MSSALGATVQFQLILEAAIGNDVETRVMKYKYFLTLLFAAGPEF